MRTRRERRIKRPRSNIETGRRIATADALAKRSWPRVTGRRRASKIVVALASEAKDSVDQTGKYHPGTDRCWQRVVSGDFELHAGFLASTYRLSPRSDIFAEARCKIFRSSLFRRLILTV